VIRADGESRRPLRQSRRAASMSCCRCFNGWPTDDVNDP